MNTNIKFKRVKAYRVLQEKLRNKALAKGVNLIAPDTIYLSNDTNFGRNVTVEPYVVIGKKVKIGNNSLIKSFSHIEETIIKNNFSVGPYARLRPGTILKTNTIFIVGSQLFFCPYLKNQIIGQFFAKF